MRARAGTGLTRQLYTLLCALDGTGGRLKPTLQQLAHSTHQSKVWGLSRWGLLEGSSTRPLCSVPDTTEYPHRHVVWPVAGLDHLLLSHELASWSKATQDFEYFIKDVKTLNNTRHYNKHVGWGHTDLSWKLLRAHKTTQVNPWNIFFPTSGRQRHQTTLSIPGHAEVVRQWAVQFLPPHHPRDTGGKREVLSHPASPSPPLSILIRGSHGSEIASPLLINVKIIIKKKLYTKTKIPNKKHFQEIMVDIKINTLTLMKNYVYLW